MAINPEEITTVRVDQLANVGLTLESLFPHTVGTELTSSSIQDLATLVATTIETLNGFGFLPVSVTDGQTLPAIPTNPSFILVGSGTYTNLNGFPDIICTENLNALMTLTDHWEIAVEIPINPLTGSVQSVTGSAVDNTDPLNPVVNLDSAVTSVNGLTGAVVLDGTNIEVTDPTTSTEATLNDALQNILDNSVGATPDLQAVTDVGNTITDGTDTNTVSASAVSINDGVDFVELQKTQVQLTDFSQTATLTKDGLVISDGTNEAQLYKTQLSVSDGLNQAFLYADRINYGSIDYPLPTGASSQIATLADITGGGYTVVNASLTAVNDTNYTVVANATFTDPTPTEGKGYVVYVRNGTATIGGVGYAVGSLVFRVYHSGSWSTREYKSNLTIDATPTNGSTNAVQSDGVFDALALKQNNTTVFKNTTQTVVNGTTGEVIIYAEEVLANTISNNTILSFKSRSFRSPRAGTCIYKLYINTVNNLSGSPVQIARFDANANVGAGPLERDYLIKDNILSGFQFNISIITDIIGSNVDKGTTTYNINTTYYWILTAQPNTSSDSLTHSFSILERI